MRAVARSQQIHGEKCGLAVGAELREETTGGVGEASPHPARRFLNLVLNFFQQPILHVESRLGNLPDGVGANRSPWSAGLMERGKPGSQEKMLKRSCFPGLLVSRVDRIRVG